MTRPLHPHANTCVNVAPKSLETITIKSKQLVYSCLLPVQLTEIHKNDQLGVTNSLQDWKILRTVENYFFTNCNYTGGLKSSCDDVMSISAVDDFVNQWDPSTTTPMKEVCEPQGGLCQKLNLMWSHSMRVSW